KVAEHLISGHVEKAERGAALRCQLLAIAAGFLEEHKSPVDVGVNKVGRGTDRSLDMRFSGKIKEGFRLYLVEKRPQRIAVGDVTANKAIARISGDAG